MRRRDDLDPTSYCTKGQFEKGRDLPDGLSGSQAIEITMDKAARKKIPDWQNSGLPVKNF
jgi:hypothetical protein